MTDWTEQGWRAAAAELFACYVLEGDDPTVRAEVDRLVHGVVPADDGEAGAVVVAALLPLVGLVVPPYTNGQPYAWLRTRAAGALHDARSAGAPREPLLADAYVLAGSGALAVGLVVSTRDRKGDVDVEGLEARLRAGRLDLVRAARRWTRRGAEWVTPSGARVVFTWDTWHSFRCKAAPQPKGAA